MAYNEKLADRVREIIAATYENVEEKKMFSGVCFMVNDKMCAGIQKGHLMVRLDPAVVDNVLEKEGAVQMEMSGKIMKGYILVEASVIGTKRKLEYWINLALNYNPIAKSSKKKKK